jgi:hypothetical protein
MCLKSGEAKMSELKQPDYRGIFLEPDKICYQEIDRPLRKLIELINGQSWLTSYGCCAGQAHHGEDAGLEHQFYIGLFVDETTDGIAHLRQWLEESNRLNGPTGLEAEITGVYQHPFGQGSVDGWAAYRITARLRKDTLPAGPQTYLRLIKCLQTAWGRW